MTLWSIGRLMPSGTMTAVAVAVGHRLCGFPGTVVALIAMIIPGFVCVVVLTIAYGYLAHGAVLDYIDATLLPAALGIVVVSAVRLGKPLFRVSLDMVFAIAACVAAARRRMSARPRCCSSAASPARLPARQRKAAEETKP